MISQCVSWATDMKLIFYKLLTFFIDERGGEVVEWAVVVAVIASFAIAAYLNGGLDIAIQAAIQSIVDNINAL